MHLFSLCMYMLVPVYPASLSTTAEREREEDKKKEGRKVSRERERNVKKNKKKIGITP